MDKPIDEYEDFRARVAKYQAAMEKASEEYMAMFDLSECHAGHECGSPWCAEDEGGNTICDRRRNGAPRRGMA